MDCDFCGSKETKKLWDNVVECLQCGLVYLNPRPHDLSSFYNAEYSAYHPISGIKRHIKKFLLWKEVKSLSNILPKNPKVLDVGCGGGEDVYFFNQAGWQATGSDAMPEAAVQAKKELGVEVLVGTLEDLKFPDASYDMVRMKFALSHVASPQSTLKEIYRILKPNGIFSVWVPNVDSWGAKLFKKNWIGGAPYTGQLWNFSSETLSKYLQRHNFKIQKIKHSIVPNTFVHSMKMKFTVFNLLLFLPLAMLAALVKQSDRIIVTARK